MNDKWLKKIRWYVLLAIAVLMFGSISVLASEDDNSLSSLGIITEGAVVSPEFSYSTWYYTVTVPAGTKELELDPVPSSASATISSITGTTLNEDGTGDVNITVQAGNGTTFTYELSVVSDGEAPAAETEAATEKATETETEKQTEAQTEDSQYVKVDKNSLQEAENTITDLKGEITKYKGKVSLYTKIMYGLIALAVIFLFIVINLLLKKKDLKSELNDYRSYGYTENKPDKSAKKVQKAQKKAKKKEEMFDDDDEFRSVPPYGTDGPAMGGYPGAGMNASPAEQQIQSFYQPGTPQPSYPGLDVQPQKSQKKSKKMPEYEAPAPAPKQEKVLKENKKDKKNNVEIDMIDL